MRDAPSPGEIEAVLQSGDLDQLIGLVEDDRLECKREPYRLDQESQKMELAKDVCGLANVRGGLILIGCRTERGPTLFGDVVREVSPFPQQLIDPQHYHNVIRDWIYPPLRVDVRWFPSATDAAKGIVVIAVPEDAAQNRPFLVTKIVDETGKLRGTLFGFFERQRDTVPSLSVQELRDRLKDGLRFSDLDRRLENIEQTIAQAAANSAPTAPSLSPDVLQDRISEARQAAGLHGEPSFILAAIPVEKVQFPDLFASRGLPLVRLLEDPPSLRQNGFDLNTGQPSLIVRGALRRCMSPRDKLLELWRDGLLLFVASGDANNLAWAQSDTSRGLRINTWVLVETTYIFAKLTVELMRQAQPEPRRIQLSLALNDMNVGGNPCQLEQFARKPNCAYLTAPLSAPDRTAMVTVEGDLCSATPGVLAYSLLSELYVWFGFNADQVPLADLSQTPPVIDPDFITGKRQAGHAS